MTKDYVEGTCSTHGIVVLMYNILFGESQGMRFFVKHMCI